jgi:hypothetical protein
MYRGIGIKEYITAELKSEELLVKAICPDVRCSLVARSKMKNSIQNRVPCSL